MSDHEHTTNARALDALVAEAKEHFDVATVEARDVDWSRVEERLMQAIDEEKPVQRVHAGRVGVGRRTAIRGAALALAAAAAVTIFVRSGRDQTVVAASVGPAESALASSLRALEGAGELRVGKTAVAPGYALRASDAMEVLGTRAIFDRPGKVSWLLEQDGTNTPARARVTSAGESLVLALEDGAIEAQVVPVASGEAFAVDIATDNGVVRVAVHGTHLRVARADRRVVVDLTEGVVSIGVPPRSGMTHGTTVTAPAHVELDATDLRTLRIDHAPASVRTAISLGERALVAAPGHGETETTTPVPPALVPGPTAPAKGGVSSTVAPKPDTQKAPLLPPREAIAASVRACAHAHSRPGDVHVVLTSHLNLRVSSSGVIESAQFNPPLSPEIQACAAESIYKLKLEETGLVTIPIEYSY